MKFLLRYIVFFLYLSNIHFLFLPEKLRTRILVGIIGLIYYVIKFKGKDIYKVRLPITFIYPLALSMLLSIIINMSDQLWFLQYVIQQIILIFGAVYVIHITRINKFTTLLWYFLIYIIIQDTFAFVSLLIPRIWDVIGLMVDKGVSESTELEIESQFRAFGFGDFHLFGGGVWVAFGLLSLTFLYKCKEIASIMYVLLFVYLLITGLFVARTALTGLIAISVLLIPFRKSWYKIIVWAIWGGVFLLILNQQQEMLEENGISTGYAFEIFDKFSETGEIQSNSFNATNEMWKTIPKEIDTWIFGDAKYMDENGGYYMGVDVGYLRIIFYGGLIGLFFYLLYMVKLASLAYKRSGGDRILKQFLLLYLILVFVWLWKGHYDTNCILYLILFSSTYRQLLATKRL